MPLVLAIYVACAFAYAVLATLTVLRRENRPTSIKRFFFAACLGNALWASLLVFGRFIPPSINSVAATISVAVWLIFLTRLLAPQEVSVGRYWLRGDFGITVPIIGLATLGSEISLFATGDISSGSYSQAPLIGNLALAIVGMALVESFYRKTEADQRWAIRPLCIGLGSMFAFDLYLFSDALLFRQLAPALLASRALLHAFVVPLLAMAAARSANWGVPIRVSRDAVIHGVALIASGVFLLSVAIIGFLVRRYGGEWTLILQVSLLFGAGTILTIVLTSGTVKSYIRRWIVENFFPYRYDYRREWIKFIETLSSRESQIPLQERVIRAIAEIIDSPGGVLFQLRDGEYLPTARWHIEPAMIEVREKASGRLIQAFRDGEQIQIFGQGSQHENPDWANIFWLAVPLVHRDQLIGFVAFSRSRAPLDIDWEVAELLRTVARQAGSYLAEHDAAASLVDANMFSEFNKKFAFVIHDIKNLSSQLSLIVSNAQTHGGDPAFQNDVMLTIENSASRLKKLLSQLKTEHKNPVQPTIDIGGLLRGIVSNHANRVRLRLSCETTPILARIDSGALHSAAVHLIDNALDASAAIDIVDIRVEPRDDTVMIEISDLGPGMEMNFIAESLFRPFRTTKDDGLGIGAFETREIIRAAGGRLEVISKPGYGTTMRIILPREPRGAESEISIFANA